VESEASLDEPVERTRLWSRGNIEKQKALTRRRRRSSGCIYFFCYSCLRNLSPEKISHVLAKPPPSLTQSASSSCSAEVLKQKGNLILLQHDCIIWNLTLSIRLHRVFKSGKLLLLQFSLQRYTNAKKPLVG
jgi:hypothetical protein